MIRYGTGQVYHGARATRTRCRPVRPCALCIPVGVACCLVSGNVWPSRDATLVLFSAVSVGAHTRTRLVLAAPEECPQRVRDFEIHTARVVDSLLTVTFEEEPSWAAHCPSPEPICEAYCHFGDWSVRVCQMRLCVASKSQSHLWYCVLRQKQMNAAGRCGGVLEPAID